LRAAAAVLVKLIGSNNANLAELLRAALFLCGTLKEVCTDWQWVLSWPRLVSVQCSLQHAVWTGGDLFSKISGDLQRRYLKYATGMT